MTKLLEVFLLSMTPIGELRLSIPIGLAVYHLNTFLVFFVAIIGNLVPALFLLFFLKKISNYLSSKSALFKKIFGWWENNAKEKHIKGIQKYGAVGLALFIAVPLPLTGAWTGALLATLMNLPIKKSVPAIVAGVAGAGIIVTAMVIFGINLEKYLGWKMLVGLIVAVVIILLACKILNKK